MDVRLGFTDDEPGDSEHGVGELVEASGIYRLDCHAERAIETIALIRGQLFPPCAECGDMGKYRLVHGAPYILDDPDFIE